ncbi:MAG: hypothetical protein QM770_02860 [Tepidisphaeraceae bacterium]
MSVILALHGFALPDAGREESAARQLVPAVAAASSDDSASPFEDNSFETIRSFRSAARIANDSRVRMMDRSKLRFPPVILDGAQVMSVGIAIGRIIRQRSIACHACVVLPGHVQLVLAGIDAATGSELADEFKQASVQQLTEDGLHPFRPARPANPCATA